MLGLATFSTTSFAAAFVGFLTSGLALLAGFFDTGTGLTFSGALGEGLLGALIAFVAMVFALAFFVSGFLVAGFFVTGLVAAFLVANFVAPADLADLAIGFLVGMARPQFKK
ncbi:MAG TPA: hypothetical protein PLH13_02700 [Burkholderiaceae bacterium]|nr:hypothetical protein [Burkholderiaceae bacterium]